MRRACGGQKGKGPRNRAGASGPSEIASPWGDANDRQEQQRGSRLDLCQLRFHRLRPCFVGGSLSDSLLMFNIANYPF
jgi:hypothetical protein